MVTSATDQDFEKLIKENEKVIVKFHADWCGNCKLIAPKFKRLSNDERFSGIAFLDVDSERNPAFRDLVKVDNLPFFAVFKNGILIEASAGSKEEFVVSLLEKLNA